MRKLTLFLFLLCVATFAPAVTLSWNVTLTNKQSDTDPLRGPGWCGLVILYGAQPELTVAQFKTMVGNPTASSYTIASQKGVAAVLDAGTSTYKNMGEGNNDRPKVSGIFNTQGNSAVTFVLFNIWNMKNANDRAVEMLTVDGLSTTSDSTVDLGMMTWVNNTTHHTTMSVPEPTVFALLALGVAAVALRRKH
ncbi:MAG: PEP-CTERM sorting domain-containing protein [Kiritimatiellia bacterium]